MENQDRNHEIKKVTKNLALWTFLWLVSLAIATFGPIFLWEGKTTLSILAILLTTALGVGMIWANIRHLNVLDELQRKIQMDAMGIALGVGIVGGLSYSVMDIANVIPVDAEIGFLVMLISFSYIISLLVAKRRYA